jgi:hypothetical protein
MMMTVKTPAMTSFLIGDTDSVGNVSDERTPNYGSDGNKHDEIAGLLLAETIYSHQKWSQPQAV